jgi:5-methylcytosine-specific restriction endonuclease McrA
MRREFTKSTRAAAFERSCGHCECGCGLKIIGTPQYDHIVPDAINGSNDLNNCMVMDPKCHRRKTSTKDIPAISKSVRVAEKRMGLRAPKRGGFKRPPASFNTWTRTWRD